MTSPKRICVLFLLLLALSADAFAGGFQLNESGARGMAQAGAFVARASDGSAIFWNPAGLGFQETGSAYLGTTLILPTASFYGPLQNNTNEQTKQKAKLFTPINAYVTYPLMENIHVGFGVNNPFGLGTEWPDTWAGRFLTISADLKAFYFTPTVAWRVSDQFSIGLGVNYVYGTVKLTRDVSITSVNVPTAPRVTLDLSTNGWGANAGLLYKFSPQLSAGLSYRSQVVVKATGSATFNPNYAPLNLPQGDAVVHLTLPGTGFLGIAYKPNESLEMEADVQYIQWSTYTDLTVEFQSTGTRSSTPKNYKDTYIARLGGEYTTGPYHFRGGYFYDHSPVETAYVDPVLPDADRHGLNVGFGYDISSNINVDIAYLFLKFVERKVDNSIPETSFDGTYHTYVNLIGLNVGYKF